MGVASGCGVVSRRWVWLVGESGIYGCGCKEVYRFPTTIPTPLVSVLFAAASLLVVHFLYGIYYLW